MNAILTWLTLPRKKLSVNIKFTVIINSKFRKRKISLKQKWNLLAIVITVIQTLNKKENSEI